MKNFDEKLKYPLYKWYENNKRNLPWRKTSDAYKIWVSEVMLQQTRVNQVVEYYCNFINYFPDVQALASASLERVLKIWQGLGYYSRARNLHIAANVIVEKYNGKIPEVYDELLKINGIGKYTAAAIASIAFNQPYAVIDGNVLRVLARLYADMLPINKSNAYNHYHKLMLKIFDKQNPALFNQAIMELGALICVPQKPKCQFCPIYSFCLSFQNNISHQLPIKLNNTKKRKRYFLYFAITDTERIIFRKRNNDDIWPDLFDFPFLETENINHHDFIEKLHNLAQLFSFEIQNIKFTPKTFRHILTHQILYIQFIQVYVKFNNLNLKPPYELVKVSNINLYPMPIVIAKNIEYLFDFNK